MLQSEAFNPADAGTSETAWLSLLGSSATWSPPPEPLVVVSPHPDDEILGAGGLIRTWALAGRAVTLISVTDGEAADVRRADLSLVRRAELRAALYALGAGAVIVRRLGIPDGRVAQHRECLRAAVRACANGIGTLVAPYEHDGHPDHEAVGQVCLEIAASESISLARYPIWTWHHAEPGEVQALHWRIFPLDDSARAAKRRALQCFESQLRPPRGLPIVPAHVLSHFDRTFEAFLL